MNYVIEFISTSSPGTNKKRNLEKRIEAGNYLVDNGFSEMTIPAVRDVEKMQRNYRGRGLKNTSLYGDHFVIARNSEDKIIGAARLHCAEPIIDAALGMELPRVAQNHLNKMVLKQLFVEPTERHKGVGSRLVKKALEEAESLGARQMYGYAENDTPQLVGFYKKLGFAIEVGDQPSSIFGDFPEKIRNVREGGVFFQQPLGQESKQSSKEKQPILREDESENPKATPQPSCADVENGKTESRTMPAGTGREGRKRGKRGIRDRIRGLSPEAQYRIGNTGIILVQTLLFLGANILANFSGWWGDRSVLGAVGWSVFFVISLSMYYMPVWDQEKEPPRRIIGLVIVAFVAAIPTIVEAFLAVDQANSSWWKVVKLVIGTVCQVLAGYIAWKAAELIPTPSAENGKESS